MNIICLNKTKKLETTPKLKKTQKSEENPWFGPNSCFSIFSIRVCLGFPQVFSKTRKPKALSVFQVGGRRKPKKTLLFAVQKNTRTTKNQKRTSKNPRRILTVARCLFSRNFGFPRFFLFVKKQCFFAFQAFRFSKWVGPENKKKPRSFLLFHLDGPRDDTKTLVKDHKNIAALTCSEWNLAVINECQLTKCFCSGICIVLPTCGDVASEVPLALLVRRVVGVRVSVQVAV